MELTKKLRAMGKIVDLQIYDGADHAFFNDSRPEVYKSEAAKDAWQRTITFFKQSLVARG